LLTDRDGRTFGGSPHCATIVRVVGLLESTVRPPLRFREESEPTMTTPAYLPARRDRTIDPGAAVATLPRRERRASHQFEVAGSSPDRHASSDACAVCGFAEASHRGFSDLEHQAIAELLNRLPSSPFMRRGILRKLDIS
jgi:hypothetical protein